VIRKFSLEAMVRGVTGVYDELSHRRSPHSEAPPVKVDGVAVGEFPPGSPR
jgi:hypothetical protein